MYSLVSVCGRSLGGGLAIGWPFESAAGAGQSPPQGYMGLSERETRSSNRGRVMRKGLTEQTTRAIIRARARNSRRLNKGNPLLQLNAY